MLLNAAAKNRGIAIPVDLDSQVNTLFNKSQMVMKHTRHWINAGKNRRDSSMQINRDYRSIIEGLQVQLHTWLLTFDYMVLQHVIWTFWKKMKFYSYCPKVIKFLSTLYSTKVLSLTNRAVIICQMVDTIDLEAFDDKIDHNFVHVDQF